MPPELVCTLLKRMLRTEPRKLEVDLRIQLAMNIGDVAVRDDISAGGGIKNDLAERCSVFTRGLGSARL
jgi:hypothetical protein